MVDYNKLLTDVADAARKSFDACRERVGTDRILGYAICSDDTAIICSPIAASRNALDSLSHDNPDDFRFNPDEWDVQQDVAELRAVNDAIYSLIYELHVQSLERLDRDG